MGVMTIIRRIYYVEIKQTFVFSVFSQITAICVGEKGETGGIRIRIWQVPYPVRLQRLGAFADTISANFVFRGQY
jgi:hypothetical protein